MLVENKQKSRISPVGMAYLVEQKDKLSLKSETRASSTGVFQSLSLGSRRKQLFACEFVFLTQEIQMLNVKQASKLAIEYFADLYEEKYPNLNLEEAEISEDGKYWFITLGYDVSTPFSPMLSSSLARTGREFKRFKIDIETGKVLSMQIRKID